MQKLIEKLVSYERLIHDDGEIIQLEGVTFLESFGPWQAGDSIACLEFNCWDSAPIINEYSDSWIEIVKSCHVKLAPF